MNQSVIVPAMLPLATPTGNGYSKWNFKLQGGQVYHGIEITTNLAVKSTLKKATIDIGGTPMVTASGAHLEMINKALSRSETAGIIDLDLAKFECRSPRGIYQTSLPTSIYDDVTLTLEFGAKDATDPATLSVSGAAWVSENPSANVVGGGRRFVPSLYELTQYAAAAGAHNWTFPNGSVNKSIQRLILDESEVSISKVIVKRGTKTIREMTRARIDHALKRHGGYTLQAGYLILDFILFGFGFNDALTTEGLNFEFEVDGVGAIKTVVDGFEQVAA
ncbi:major capsid protein P2 [Neptunicella sp. SCSIO 80796]|uniref:major capsid protein P2 n=1 Tax=Neptunicella plasticusilytica TaxID=3117012 RepID=UPI003A4E4DBE